MNYLCLLLCGFASVLLFSMVYMMLTFSSDKKLKQILDKEQYNRYQKIVNERRNLMLSGYIFGLIMTTFVIFFIKNTLLRVSMAIITVYVVSYLYYTLSPKSDYMILHLETKEKRQAWLDTYLYMKRNFHLSYLYGILFVAVIVLINDNMDKK